MLGKATLTIETSSKVINPAARTTASAFQRSGSARYSPWSGGAERVEAAEATDRGLSISGVVVVMTISSRRVSLHVQPHSAVSPPPPHPWMPWSHPWAAGSDHAVLQHSD